MYVKILITRSAETKVDDMSDDELTSYYHFDCGIDPFTRVACIINGSTKNQSRIDHCFV